MKKKHMYLLSKIVNGEKKYLRYGLNGAGNIGYCVYRGKIVCFETNDEAQEVRASLSAPELWDVERFVR